MPDYFKNITDSMKFLVMLIIYTGYMTWWASGVSHDLAAVTLHVNQHTAISDHPVQQTLAITSLIATQIKMSTILEKSTSQHVRCTVIMENIIRRLEGMEERERAWGDS